MPANFVRPSWELLRFIEQLQSLFLYFAHEYRTVDDSELFSAYIRNGAETVFCTYDSATLPIEWNGEEGCCEGEDEGDALEPDSDGSSSSDRVVVMDSDRAGDWVVARFYVRGWKRFSVLYSSDFVLKNGEDRAKAVRLLARIARHLAKHAHKVPRAT